MQNNRQQNVPVIVNIIQRMRAMFVAVCGALLMQTLPAWGYGIYGHLYYTIDSSANTATIVGYDGSSGSLEIPSNIYSRPVTFIAGNSFDCDYSGKLSGIIIPSTVTNIGAGAFGYCYGLRTLSIPASVQILADGVFSACLNLTNVTLSNGICTIGQEAFFQCTNLPSIQIPGSVTNIGDRAFGFEYSMTNIGVDSLNSYYSSVDGILFNKDQSRLLQCPAGKRGVGAYTIPSTVLDIGNYAFECCRGVSNITIGSSVTNIGKYAFYGTPITNLVLPDNVQTIGNMSFCGTSLLHATVGNGVGNIPESSFGESYSLTRVILGTGVTNIESGAFNVDNALTSLIFRGNAPTLSDTNAFESTTNVTLCYFAGSTGWGPTLGGRPTLQITGTEAPVFASQPSNQTVAAGDSATFTAPAASLTDITYFWMSNGVVILETNVSYYTLSETQLSDSGTDYRCLASNAYGTTLSSTATLSVYSSSGTSGNFYYTRTATDATITGYFYDENWIDPLVIPSSIDGVPVVSIGSYALTYLTNSSVTIPPSVTNIDEGAFHFCTNFSTITIPDNVVTIMNYAFYYCMNLRSVTVGKGLTSIEYSAFSYCFNLTSILFAGDAPSYTGNLFNGDTLTVYYCSGTSGWEDYFSSQPCQIWNPQIQTTGEGLGVQDGQFVISLGNITNFPIVLEACTNLASPDWVPVLTNSLSDGTASFTDLAWTNTPARFYRIRSLE